jgi:ribonuclease E
MTVVDVNTGKFTGSGGNLEQTVTKNNLEAAEEIVRQLRLRDIGGIVVIDFIDMVLESNRDLVLRRLTESLARDRTRHQVSEVTSLGLVQLTRKRLGTGLIEAFSTSCPQCAGRGILLHADPVDSAPAAGRKSESGGGGRRGRRSKKNRSEEPGDKAVVAKVPVHAPGEHPMFKAMAAGSATRDDDDESDDNGEEVVAEADEQTDNGGPVDDAEFEDRGEADDSEDDSDDSDEFDDEADLDDDEDDLDDEDDDEDDDDEDDFDDDDDDDDEDDSEVAEGTAVVLDSGFGRPRRRRAAGRPAGPPIHAD